MTKMEARKKESAKGKDRRKGSESVSKLPKYSAPALEKGLDILELLSSSEVPLSLVDIAVKLDRSKGELFRMVVALERRGYLRQTEEGFQLTNRLFELGIKSPPYADLIDSAIPIMQKYSDQVGQSCHLAVLSGSSHVVIARHESREPLSFSVRLGYSRRFDESTSGRLLFACLTAEHQRQLLQGFPRSAKIDKERLKSAAEQYSLHGFIIERSDSVEGIVDVSTPVFGRYDEPLAALTSSTVKFVGSDLDLYELAEQLKSSAEEIGALMCGDKSV